VTRVLSKTNQVILAAARDIKAFSTMLRDECETGLSPGVIAVVAREDPFLPSLLRA
jgi:hypothetical protein